MFNLKITMSKITFICSIFVALLFVLLFFAKIISDFYIIHKTEQTLRILQQSYTAVLAETELKWTPQDMNTNVFAKEFIKDLPFKKNCKYTDDESCFPMIVNFKNPIGTRMKNYQVNEYYKLKLDNNVGVAFNILHPDCNDVRNRCGTILIDVNGPKRGPNKFGVDLYDFGIYKDEIKLYNMKANHYPRCINGTGQGCAAYMIKYHTRFYKLFSKDLKPVEKNVRKPVVKVEKQVEKQTEKSVENKAAKPAVKPAK